jgi:hypothetical protein
MSPFVAAIMIAAFEALKWLLWATAALLALLIVVQALRGDETARPGLNVILCLGFAGAGLASGWAARKVEAYAKGA